MSGSSVTLVLDALVNKLTRLMPNTKIVYSVDQSYSEALKRLRVTTKLPDGKENKNAAKQLPLFAYSRSPLRPSNLQGRRFPTARSNKINDETRQIRFSVSEFDFNFTYYFNSISDAEVFELNFSTDMYNENSNIIVDLSEYGLSNMMYSINWSQNLDNLVLGQNDNSFISFTGSGVITGTFVVLLDDKFNVIEKIETDIYENKNKNKISKFEITE